MGKTTMMFVSAVVAVLLLLSGFGAGAGYVARNVARKAQAGFKTEDPQVAAGEWSIEVQHPPCDNVHNIKVIWPKDSDGPVRIECSQMPVKTK